MKGPAMKGPAMKGNVGKVVLDCLRAEGVRHVFGIVGSSFLESVDVFTDATAIDVIVDAEEF